MSKILWRGFIWFVCAFFIGKMLFFLYKMPSLTKEDKILLIVAGIIAILLTAADLSFRGHKEGALILVLSPLFAGFAIFSFGIKVYTSDGKNVTMLVLPVCYILLAICLVTAIVDETKGKKRALSVLGVTEGFFGFILAFCRVQF